MAQPFGCFLVVLLGVATARADEAKLKPDVQSLESRFQVKQARFDADKRRFVWVLEAKETAAEPCLFDAVFLDADDREVTTVKVEFEDGGQSTELGAKQRAWVKYPTQKTMQKVARILIRKSDR